MKKLSFVLLTIAIFAMIGCSDSLVEPTGSNHSNVQKKLITLPESRSLSTESSLITVKIINGDKGGRIPLTGFLSNLLKFNSHTEVPAGAFNGTVIITQTVTDFAGVDFFPSMTFKKPLISDFKFIGLNLTDINPDEIEFGYLAPDDRFEPSENDGIIVDIASGTLAVKNARIYHFSRWCFVH